MTTPTQTEYGPEISCSGRPSWLKDDDKIQWIDGTCWTDWDRWEDYDGFIEAGKVSWGPNIIAIKLPASHPYYTLAAHNAKHGTQFKYWPGGARPSDWDGGKVLHAEGFLTDALDWDLIEQHNSVIGYTPKPCAPHPLDEMVRLDEEMGLYDDEPVKPKPADDFVPCERTVRMCLEALPVRYTVDQGIDAEMAAYNDAVEECHANIETLLPKKHRAEEIVRKFIGSVDDDPHIDTDARMKRLITALIAQGEIRG